MSDMITAEKSNRVLQNDGRYCGPAMAVRFARTVIALYAQLADAKAAQAMVTERAAKDARDVFSDHKDAKDAIDYMEQLIYAALADTDGLALVQSLRDRAEKAEAELAHQIELRNFQVKVKLEAIADRDRLAAANAALEAQVARLVGMVKVAGRARLIIDTSFLEMGETVNYAPSVIAEVCDMLEPHSALAAVQADARREGGE